MASSTTMKLPHEKLIQHGRSHPFPLVFATISGAHLYGFPSPDSDFDLRGVHLLPLETVVGLEEGHPPAPHSTIYLCNFGRDPKWSEKKSKMCDTETVPFSW